MEKEKEMNAGAGLFVSQGVKRSESFGDDCVLFWKITTKRCHTCHKHAIHQVLAHLLDMVFYSDEKERVIPLLVNIMHYVVPYLRNHRWG